MHTPLAILLIAVCKVPDFLSHFTSYSYFFHSVIFHLIKFFKFHFLNFILVEFHFSNFILVDFIIFNFIIFCFVFFYFFWFFLFYFIFYFIFIFVVYSILFQFILCSDRSMDSHTVMSLRPVRAFSSSRFSPSLCGFMKNRMAWWRPCRIAMSLVGRLNQSLNRKIQGKVPQLKQWQAAWAKCAPHRKLQAKFAPSDSPWKRPFQLRYRFNSETLPYTSPVKNHTDYRTGTNHETNSINLHAQRNSSDFVGLP